MFFFLFFPNFFFLTPLPFSFSSSTSCSLFLLLNLCCYSTSLLLFLRLHVSPHAFSPPSSSSVISSSQIALLQRSKWVTGSATSSAFSAAAERVLYAPQTDGKAGSSKQRHEQVERCVENLGRWSFERAISTNWAVSIRQVGQLSTCPGDRFSRLDVCGHEQPGVGQ